MRIVIYGGEAAEAGFYEEVCRKLGTEHQIPVELKVYLSSDALLFDLQNPEFRKRLDVIFFNLTEQNIEVPHEMRDVGYHGLIVLVGGAEMILPYEQLFDTEAYNFVQKNDLKRFISVFLSAAKTVAKNNEEKLSLSYGGEIRQIDIGEIQYFEVQQHTLVVHYGKGESFTFVSSLAKMEQHLKGRKFMRASRFYLISVNAVHKLSFNNALMLSGANVPVGRKFYAEIKKAMDQKVI